MTTNYGLGRETEPYLDGSKFIMDAQERIERGIAYAHARAMKRVEVIAAAQPGKDQADRN